MGFEDIERRITKRSVVPPSGLTAVELANWLNGYARCQHDVLDLLEELKKGVKE